MASDTQIGFQFGEWRAYPRRNLLAGPPGEIHIEPRVMQVLERLAGSPGEVVDREQLLEELWLGRAQTDEPLTRCIATLRRVLEDSARNPQYIQTIPKRGYRLVCPVETLSAETHDARTTSSSGPVRRRAVAAATAVLALFAALVVYRYHAGSSTDSVELTAARSTQVEPSANSIAVLPFANLSRKPGNVYLSDGLAAELTHLLTTIPNLQVAARTSSFSFKGRNVDVTEIAKQLRVAHVLSGSVRQSGERLRIAAHLVDARSGYQLWSDSWDREFTDIFVIQDEIAAAVVDAMRFRLLHDMPTVKRADSEAYVFYLKGKNAFRESKEALIGDGETPRTAQALALTMHALAADPEYAPAWAQLAAIQLNQAQWLTSDAGEAFARARASAQRALELDPTEPAALTVRGGIADLWDWDSVAAAGWYRRAIDAAPGAASTLNAISILYGRFGRRPIAHEYLSAAVDRDPLNSTLLINLALSYAGIEGIDRGIEQLAKAGQLAPDAVRVQAIGARLAYIDEDFQRAARLAESVNLPLWICSIYQLGQVEKVRAELDKIGNRDTPDAYRVAGAYACQGDRDNAFVWLKTAYENRETRLRWIRDNELMSSLHDDPRWEPLLRDLDLSEEQAELVSTLIGRAGLDF